MEYPNPSTKFDHLYIKANNLQTKLFEGHLKIASFLIIQNISYRFFGNVVRGKHAFFSLVAKRQFRALRPESF